MRRCRESPSTPCTSRRERIFGRDGPPAATRFRMCASAVRTRSLRTSEGFRPAVNNVGVNLGYVDARWAVVMTLATSSAKQLPSRRGPMRSSTRPHRAQPRPSRTGRSRALPTVNRTLQDFARTNPYFAPDPTDSAGTTLNVAGRNNRYNNIQIDGAVNNDLFGLVVVRHSRRPDWPSSRSRSMPSSSCSSSSRRTMSARAALPAAGSTPLPARERTTSKDRCSEGSGTSSSSARDVQPAGLCV